MHADRRRPTRIPFSTLLQLAYRNLLRQKSRTATTLTAVSFGVAVLILSQGFIEDIFVQLAEAIIHSQTGHIQLARRGYFEQGAQRPEAYLLADPAADAARIAEMPEVKEVLARLNFSGLVSTTKADLSVLGEGIEPDKEARLGTFLRMSAGRRLTAQDRYQVELGQGVAKALKLAPGDSVVLVVNTPDGAMNSLDLEVVGVFQSFSKDYDNRAVRLPLSAAQELVNTRGANALVVSLHRTADTDRLAAVLRERTLWRDQEVMSWSQLNDFHPKTVQLYQRQFGGLLLIILLMVLLSVTNSVNMTVFERSAEFGTARALGNRSGQVFQMVMVENVLLGLIGTIIGVAVGIGLAVLISRVGIPMPPPPNADLPYTAFIRVTPAGVLASAVIGLLAAVCAAILPAVRVAKMDIVTALRHSI